METKGLTALRISLASPQTIMSWSYGEVTKPETIINALIAQKKTEQWTRDGGKYIPHASTWLNQERWNDEIERGEAKGYTAWTGRTIDGYTG